MSPRRTTAALFAIAARAVLPACASRRDDTGMSQTADRDPRAGTGVLVVQNQTDEMIEVWGDENFIGSVSAGESRRFPNMPLEATTLTARSDTGSAVIDSDNVDFAGALDSTVTFVVDGR